MSPHDADEGSDTATTDEGEITAVALDETDTREQAIPHLREALVAAEQFHIRQALQLLDIDERYSRRGESRD